VIIPEDHGKEKNYPQGRCKVTGEKLREMQVCPHDPPKAVKKPAAKRKSKEPETRDPLRKFLNEHFEQIITGKDVPIVPFVRELYDTMQEDGLRPLKLYLSAKEDPAIDRWIWWSLSPSGKIREVKGPSGGYHCSVSDPACKFHFEWHYANEKKEQ
jgi:hypothetical protein